MKHFMSNAGLSPEVGNYSIRGEGEISISKKSLESEDVMVRRLVAMWLDLPEAYQKSGVRWYDEANEFAVNLAQTYNITTWQASQVISALSPQNPWDGKVSAAGNLYKIGNKRCATLLIKTYFEQGRSACFLLKGWGFSKAFVEKAVAVLDGEEIDWSTSPKTYRFAMLINNPRIEDMVVVDSHASRIVTGNLGGKYHVVGKAAYAPMERAYVLAANLLGLQACVLQAGLWVVAADGLLY